MVSLSSFLGIMANVFALVITLVNGWSVSNAPGSLWEAAPTWLYPESASLVFQNFGLLG